MIKSGISSLGPGESRVSYIFSFYDLHGKLNDRALTYSAGIDIDYEDYEGAKFHSHVVLDFSEYKGASEIGGGDALEKIATSLEKIQKDVSGFATGMKKLQSDIYTSEDRARQAELVKK